MNVSSPLEIITVVDTKEYESFIFRDEVVNIKGEEVSTSSYYTKDGVYIGNDWFLAKHVTEFLNLSNIEYVRTNKGIGYIGYNAKDETFCCWDTDIFRAFSIYEYDDPRWEAVQYIINEKIS